jgi:hypothetical protein
MTPRTVAEIAAECECQGIGYVGRLGYDDIRCTLHRPARDIAREAGFGGKA